MGVDDRYWDPIEQVEAERVLGPDVRVTARHRRWLFAVSRCETPDGVVYLKRQPAMGRDIAQVEWQHRVAAHVADRGVPATRPLGLLDRGKLWYELWEPAAGADTYTDTDTWEPFRSIAHVEAAGGMLARFHRAGADFAPLRPQPQAGFVVQLGRLDAPPSEVVRELADARPAVADYLGDRDLTPVGAAYGELFERLAPVAADLPIAPLHGDWQTNNLFFSGDEVSGIIDFHQTDCGPRLLDLAVAIERNCFFWNRISDGDAAYNLTHARHLVAAYHRVEPLTEAERGSLVDMVAICQFQYGISFLDYYWGIEADRPKADWAWDTFVLGHAQWWQSAAGRAARAALAAVVP
jgi:Ser/Thr protein kinase RdoA (MazF antagonist)